MFSDLAIDGENRMKRIDDTARLEWMMWRHDPMIDGLRLGSWSGRPSFNKAYRDAIDAAIKADRDRRK